MSNIPLLSSEEKANILKRKTLPGAGSKATKPFIFMAFIILPIYFGVVLPFAICCIIVQIVMKKVNGKKKAKITYPDESELVTEEVRPANARKYDLVLFGVTGYTGKLAGKYLAKNYSSDKNLKWAIGGRSESRLQAVKEELVAINKDCADLEIIIADINLKDLRPVVNNARCIITTVGPYAKYGTNMVALCAAYGTHLCDITGEIPWVQQMISNYDDLARRTGAMIVHCCGCDSIPWDITTFACYNKLKSKNQDEQIQSIEFVDYMNGAPSGGTIASVINMIEDPQPKKNRLGFDPLLKIPAKDEKTPNKFITKNQVTMGFNKKFNTWVGIQPLAGGNACVVKRSSAILNYGSKVSYKEGAANPSFMASFNSFFGMVILGTCLAAKPLRWVCQKTVLPAPGQGPTQKQLDRSWLRATCKMKGNQGTNVSMSMIFYNDPGYVDTARMLVESGLCFVFNKDEIKCGGGIWTTASCQGNTLIKRLKDSGNDFEDHE